MKLGPVYGDRPSLIVATTNRAKRQMIQRIVKDAGLVVDPPPEMVAALEHMGSDDEQAETMLEIARAKALSWSRLLPNELIVATDGGLIIPALTDRWIPTRTRRFAGFEADDSTRAQRLLALAAELRDDERRISWKEALVISRANAIIGERVAESRSGVLATKCDSELVARSDGFWVSSLWLCPEFDFQPLACLSEPDQYRCQGYWQQLGIYLRATLRDLMCHRD